MKYVKIFWVEFRKSFDETTKQMMPFYVWISAALLVYIAFCK